MSGPQFNKKRMNFTTRDNLGVDGAQTSMQGELCPVVNTVTYRAFYWPFMVWNYYDFYKYSGIKEWTNSAFDKPYLKKNDYYFVLSNLIASASDTLHMVGTEKTSEDLKKNEEGPYLYNEDYFVSRFGGMMYFNAGCMTMGYITDETESGEAIKNLPRLTKELGEPMGVAFESVIKDTSYYKEYRHNNTEIPKDVLKELGGVLNIGLKGFDECKRLLRTQFFDEKHTIRFDNTNLIKSKDYLLFLHNNYGMEELNTYVLREILFDWFSPRGEEKREYPGEIESVVKGWECVIGRQYLTISLELIWKKMLGELYSPKTIDVWISDSINESNISFDLLESLDSLCSKCNYSFDLREKLIQTSWRTQDDANCIDVAMKLILSLYNRFNNRDDVDEHWIKDFGGRTSITALIELVERYKDRPVQEFIAFIMREWIIKQHEETALEKKFAGRDGYYIEQLENQYLNRDIIPEPDFQDNRLVNLFQIMKDLDVI